MKITILTFGSILKQPNPTPQTRAFDYPFSKTDTRSPSEQNNAF